MWEGDEQWQRSGVNGLEVDGVKKKQMLKLEQ